MCASYVANVCVLVVELRFLPASVIMYAVLVLLMYRQVGNSSPTSIGGEMESPSLLLSLADALQIGSIALYRERGRQLASVARNQL